MKKLWGLTIQMKTLWQNLFLAYCAKRNLIHYFCITFFNWVVWGVRRVVKNFYKE